MFEKLCALLLRLYPAEFRRAYGREAVQLMRDRARHERGVFLRVRLLMDLAIDLFATSLHRWQPDKPLLGRLDAAPRFDIIEVHGPSPEALAAGMLTSVLMFASFTLLFQPRALPNTPAQLGGGLGSEMRGAASNDSAQQAAATDPEAHDKLIAAIAANLKQRYVDRVIASGTQSSAEYFGYILRILKRAPIVGAPPDHHSMKGWEVTGIEPDVNISKTEAFEAARKLVEETVEVPAVVQSQAFEVISIKPARSADPRNMRMRVLANGDLIASGVPVLWLLRYAYDVPVNPSPRLSGLPAWRETYDIEAKAPAKAVPAGLPENEKRHRIQGMVRGLLADRFKVVMRVEQKTMPVYALTVASGGPNLQKSTIAEKDCIFDTGTPESCHTFIVGRGHPLSARAISMDDLAQYIENWADWPVVNRTAVSGLFAVETEGWAPMRLPPPPPGNAPAARFDDLPTIFTVLRKLGLELKQQEAAVPVYAVEHIERPAVTEDDAR